MRTALVLIASSTSLGCGIRSNGPHWIETHGHAQVQRIAGGPMGLLAIGTNGLIYSYPEFGSVWHEWNARLHPRVIVGSRHGLAYADQEGRIGKGDHGRIDNPEWNLGPAVTALATDEEGYMLYAVTDGRISQLLESGSVAGPCTELRAVSIAVAQGQLWVSDGQRVYQASSASCKPAPGAPTKVVHLAGLGTRIFAVDEAGDVYRLQPKTGWQQLPRPQKFRPDQMPHLHPATDVAVTSTAAWVVDDEQNVFVLSESE
jgi:hypothetical protein